MALFQTSVLNKYLAEQDKDLLFAQYNIFKTYFLNPTIQNNIIAQKEEQFQEGFLRELFVKVLGYTINPEPDFNLTTELKNIKDAKKADGAIINNEKVLAVIELKGTDTTNLTKIEQQAFNYKNNQDGCRYVITSNFQKLRFYIDNAIEFIEWDLFKLDNEGFSLLYLCLAQPNIFNDLPAKIKTESVTVEEQVTKQLYKEYSQFRKSLFTNIVELNTNYNKLELFKKTQKLLDRFLFLFFAEDRLLVPPNSVRMILEQWTELKEKFDEYQPLYDRFKKYFGYLNTGYIGKQHEIYAYNGGLFATDDILDSIKIDDASLYNATLGLSNYDYNSEVDVNILGHIFEHSLTEIEELEKEITSTDIVDAKTTKRKKDGVFYTPKYITKYIVENTVGILCKNKKEELKLQEEDYHKLTKKAKKQLYDNLMQYREWLLHITIIDPACGSGAFLNQALEFLIVEHRWIAELEANIFNAPMVFDVESSILENNLFGVDINEESVEIAKLSLWLRTARKGRKLNSLNNNIKCGNSLIDDPAVAGDKAFNWQEQFPHIFERGGFDVVIGNPPYVRSQYFPNIKEYLNNNYNVYNSEADLFSYFYELSFKLLKMNGMFSFISNTFSKTTGGINLREWLKNNITLISYIDFTDVQIFDGATTYPVIIVACNNEKKGNFEFIKIKKDIHISIENGKLSKISQSNLVNENWDFKDDLENNIVQKMLIQTTVSKIYGKTYRGIITGLNEAFLVNSLKIPASQFVVPIYEGKEIKKWHTPKPNQSLIIFKSKSTKVEFGNLVESEAFMKMNESYKEIFQHLSKFEDSAKARYDKGEYWWELRNCAYYDLFNKPKIIWTNLQNSNKFCLDLNGVCINAPAVMLSMDKVEEVECLYLLGLLNSKLIWYFLKSICVVRSGGYIEVKPQYFEQIPIVKFNSNLNIPKLVEANIESTKKFYIMSDKFKLLLASKFSNLNINNKLEKWYELSFADFSKELSKQKVKLSLSEQSEWLTFFEQEKQKALVIKNEIDKTDKEIDQMVYQLYGLSEEEIKIVEG